MDTIVAISTAMGEGGIGIIRLSGEDSEKIANKIFSPSSGKALKNRFFTYGNIVDEKENIIDEVLVVYMKGPKTYTREDMVEINCHGSLVAQKRILELAIRQGARLADPGEFTKRAFLSGRIDLSQAEAVIDLIKADTDSNFDIALSQLEGSLKNKINNIRQGLLGVLAQLMVNIDFPDEDIEEENYKNLLEAVKFQQEKIETLIDSAFAGRIYKEGLKVAIVGKPNVGKSSLLNSFIGANRAIVTEIPGTTRDTISEKIIIGDIPLIITDTAGMRNTEDEVEKIGIDRSKDSFNKADLHILILDGSREIEKDDIEILKRLQGKNSIVLINKIDKDLELNIEEVKTSWKDLTFVETSIINAQGVDIVKKEIEEKILGNNIKKKEDEFITNSRHKEMLENARTYLNDSVKAIKMEEPFEIIEVDIKMAYEDLGKILGESLEEDIINQVFSKFCLGK